MERMILLGTVIVLASTITLLQVHGTAFWSSKLGASGIAWSVLLEATALWLWWRGTSGSRLLGLIASGLLLLGPLYQVATPILEGLAAAEHADAARASVIPLVETEIRGLEGQLAAFTENAKKRPGWLPAIEATQAQLREAHDKLAALYQEAPHSTARVKIQETLVIGMEILGLLLFQVTAVLAITTLAREARMGKGTFTARGIGFISHWPAELALEAAGEATTESMKTKPARAKGAAMRNTPANCAKADMPTRKGSATGTEQTNVVALTEAQGKSAKSNKTAPGGRGNTRTGGKPTRTSEGQARPAGSRTL